MTREQPQFFVNRACKRLFSILHEAPPATSKKIAVVFCAPLFEEKLWSHRVIVNFARFLASRGISVLRFDYFGDGESEGSFTEASTSSRLADVLDAIQYCREQTQCECLYVMGLGYGANLAIKAGLIEPCVAGMAAWSPVMDGARYIGDILRANLSAQMVVHRKILYDRDALVAQLQAGDIVNVEGYEIGKALYNEIIESRLIEKLRHVDKRIIVFQISPAEKVEMQYAALEQLPNNNVQFHAVRQPKFWTQQKMIFPPCDELFNKTADWLVAGARR